MSVLIIALFDEGSILTKHEEPSTHIYIICPLCLYICVIGWMDGFSDECGHYILLSNSN